MTREIDWEKVDQMLMAGCNGVQTAAALGVYPDTLYLHCEKEKNCSFTAYLQQKRSYGDGLIHAAQFQKAIKEKNPTILIWLGKQRLGQKETALEVYEVPAQGQINKDHEIMRLKNELAELKANGDKSETG